MYEYYMSIRVKYIVSNGVEENSKKEFLCGGCQSL